MWTHLCYFYDAIKRNICEKGCRIIKTKLPATSIALLGYTILTFVFLYPLIFDIGHAVYLSQDVWYWLANFSWFEKSVLDLHISPLFNPFIFYPIGEPHLGSGALILLFLIPITALFGPIVSYNTAFLLSFILSGFGTYLLTKYLTNDELSAFIAGIIFAFCPFHVSHAMGHIHIMSIEWIPFFVLYLFKTIKERTYSSTILCAIFYSFAALSSWYFAVFLLIFTVVFLVYLSFTDRNAILNKKLVIRFVSMAVLIAMIVYPFLINLFSTSREHLEKPFGEFIIWSSDLTGYFIPALRNGIYHIYFRDFLNSIYCNYTGGEKVVFVGFTVLFLALYAVIRVKNKYVKFFAIASIIFFVLSLGPILQIFGKYSLFQYSGTLRHISCGELINIVPFPLPFSLLYFLPFTNMTRSPNRYSIIVMLCLSVLVGYGIREIINRYSSSRIKQKVIPILILILILLEFMPLGAQPKVVTAPQFYHQISGDNEMYAILEMPIVGPHTKYVYYQSIHGKYLVGGCTSRRGGEYLNRYLPNLPILSDFRYVQFTKEKYPQFFRDISNQSRSAIGKSVLNYFNIKYIIIHSSSDPNIIESNNKTKTLIKEILSDINPVYVDNQITVYEVKREIDPKPFLIICDGWSSVETWEGCTGRWIDHSADIKIVSSKQDNVKLKLLVKSISTRRTLDISVNDQHVERHQIDSVRFKGDDWQEIITTSINISPGITVINFYTPKESYVTGRDQHVCMMFKETSLFDDAYTPCNNSTPI